MKLKGNKEKSQTTKVFYRQLFIDSRSNAVNIIMNIERFIVLDEKTKIIIINNNYFYGTLLS